MDSIMSQVYTAVIKRSGEWWIGWIEEIPGVNCQESTKEDLLDTLRVTLAEVIEINREQSRREAGAEFEEYAIAL